MVTPHDGMQITSDTAFAPGVYLLPAGLEIAADGVTLDGGGALLVGSGRSGRGLSLRGRRGVTIKNLRLIEYYHGIAAEDCEGLTIAGCEVRASAEEPANSLFLDVWRPAERAYGGGIWLHRVRGSALLDNDLQHQQSGLLCYSCAGLTLRGNLANHCSGFGFHLFDSSDCLVEANYADFCCRYEPRGGGRGHLGADAAGFLIVHGSCRNTFRGNYARMGGDGFFLAGLRPDLTHVPCDDNLFEGNDGSYSPNIAFEATFSRGNIFRGNRAVGCNYGFWLGFSAQSRLEGNDIRHSHRAGVAVENGFGFTLRDNELAENAYGLLLWSRFVADFAAAVPANDTSRDWLVTSNRFVRNDVAVRIAADQDHGVRGLPGGSPGCPPPHGHTLRTNLFADNRVAVEHAGCPAPAMLDNVMRGNLTADLVRS